MSSTQSNISIPTAQSIGFNCPVGDSFMFVDLYFLNFHKQENETKENEQQQLRPSRMHLGYCNDKADNYDLKKIVMSQKLNRPTKTNSIDFAVRAQSLICMRKMANHFNLSDLTYFKAVAIMDWFLSQIRVEVDDYEILFETSVIIASKLFELQINSIKPTILSLCKQIPIDHSLYISWEMDLLIELNWKPNIITVHDFTELFLQRGIITEQDFDFKITSGQLKIYIDCADKIIENLLFMIIRDFGYYRFTPYVLANGIIACTRSTLALIEWSSALELVTSLKLFDFKEVFDLLKYTITSSQESVAYFQNILIKYFGNSFPIKADIQQTATPIVTKAPENQMEIELSADHHLNDVSECISEQSLGLENKFFKENQKKFLNETMDTEKSNSIKQFHHRFLEITECEIKNKPKKKISKIRKTHQRFQHMILSDIVIDEASGTNKLKKRKTRRFSQA